ncbi:MAG TPA: methyltransferase domain-containing protein [Burkholderiales bacterium]|nr:methyltransferase domain-containing protein [Burkholderiales bacterium]
MAETRDPHALSEPSPWVARWAERVPCGGVVLDVACGRGRHARYFAARGYRVEAVDRDAAAIAALHGIAGVTAVRADLEGGEWPYRGRLFEAVVVTNYLHRPLMSLLVDAVAPGGVLIYETFAAGHERYGRPSNPDYLLQPGELLEAVRGRLRVIAYEDVSQAEPTPACVQRLCALREPAPAR